MTALLIGASLGTTGSLRKMTEQASPNSTALRITQAIRERQRPEKCLGFAPVAYALGSPDALGSLEQQRIR